MAIISATPSARNSWLGGTMCQYPLNSTSTTSRYSPPNQSASTTGSSPSTTTGIDGESNGALTYTGLSSANMQLDYNHGRGVTNGITVSMWYYAVSADVSGSRTLFSIGDSTAGGGPHNIRFFNGVDSNKLLMSNDGNNPTVNFGTNAATLDTWYHIAFTWNGTLTNPNFVLYHNGTQVNTFYSSTVNSTISSGRTHFLGRRPNNSTSWNGRIAKLWVFNESKSASFIRQLYERRI